MTTHIRCPHCYNIIFISAQTFDGELQYPRDMNVDDFFNLIPPDPFYYARARHAVATGRYYDGAYHGIPTVGELWDTNLLRLPNIGKKTASWLHSVLITPPGKHRANP